VVVRVVGSKPAAMASRARVGFSALAFAMTFAMTFAPSARAQAEARPGEPPVPNAVDDRAGKIEFLLQLPAGFAAEVPAPLVVLGAAADTLPSVRTRCGELAQRLAGMGFVVVAPANLLAPSAAAADLAPLWRELRRRVRIEQGGMHAVLMGVGAEADLELLRWLAPQRCEFQTVTMQGMVAGPTADALAKALEMPRRRVRRFAGDAAALPAHLAALHAERAMTGVAREVAAALDDFHDAAANADEVRYFALLPEDSVFLGTDGSERWDGKAFREFAMRYFERDSAWTYVALDRHVELGPNGDLAWFDETFEHDAYGECRGTGVLQRRGGRWVLRQYHLTMPVPNDLARGVTAQIRAFQRRGTLAPTTVVVVRHAEKVDQSQDAALSEAGLRRAATLAAALRDLPVTAVYTSQFQRTQQTVAPLCQVLRLAAKVVPANDAAALASAIAAHAGGTVVVCGHSNTVPDLLDKLGVKQAPAIADATFDHLFVVRLDLAGASLLPLRYGP
jgi:phosphohistidine phosphatase SixA